MASAVFTAEKRIALLRLFAAGSTIPDAAEGADVKTQTVKGWLTKGRKENDGPYAEFAQVVDVVRGSADESEPMTVEDLERAVWKSVRVGSVTAMKLAWEILKARDPDDAAPADPFSELDVFESPVVQLDRERRSRQRGR